MGREGGRTEGEERGREDYLDDIMYTITISAKLSFNISNICSVSIGRDEQCSDSLQQTYHHAAQQSNLCIKLEK